MKGESYIVANMKRTKGLFPLLGINGCLRLLVLTFLVLGHRVVATRTEVPKYSAIKTIQSEDGDIVDCVDIYKQPAFDHPLLMNHTIEMRPSFIPKLGREGNFSSQVNIEQIWKKNGSCPEGTIPIQRARRSISSESYGVNDDEPTNCVVQTAGADANATLGTPYHGVSAQINVWDPFVEDKEWSLNSVIAVDEANLVEAGYGVSPVLFGDSKARIFANWRNGDKGCFNLKCPGFVQVSNGFMLGAVLSPISTYDGKQYLTEPIIYKDDIQHKWWLMFRDQVIGYWPISLFSGLHGATQVQWLGRVCNTEVKGYHTITQMGSGRFPDEGYRRSSFFRNMLFKYQYTDFVAPALTDVDHSASAEGCYNVQELNQPKEDKGPGFFYGGPGGVCCDRHCK